MRWLRDPLLVVEGLTMRFGGLAGAFFGARQGFVNPRSFEFLELSLIHI